MVAGSGLAEADPGLASLLGIFSGLVSGEAMPARNRIQRIQPRAADHLNRDRSTRQIIERRGPGRLHRRLGWRQSALLLWLLISVGLIAVALALSNRGTGGCVQPWVTACAGRAPAYVSPAP
jgi:hypothetical protein